MGVKRRPNVSVALRKSGSWDCLKMYWQGEVRPNKRSEMPILDQAQAQLWPHIQRTFIILSPARCPAKTPVVHFLLSDLTLLTDCFLQSLLSLFITTSKSYLRHTPSASFFVLVMRIELCSGVETNIRASHPLSYSKVELINLINLIKH
jgi:hypothetical protein